MTTQRRSKATARKRVELGPGLEFPAAGVERTVVVGEYAVTVKVMPRPAEGRLVVAAVTVAQTPGGPPVDATALRSVSTASLLVDVARDELVEVDGKAVAIHADPEEVRRRGPGDDFALEAAAVVFARAHAVGNEPTKAVVDALGLHRASAVRWINRARERGFLSEAQRSRRGQKHGQH